MNNRTQITTQPIKIVQLNVQRKKHLTLQLLNDPPTDFDILLIQEPAWSFIGRDPNSGKEVTGPVAVQGWATILPVTSLNVDSPRPRTLTYYRPRPDYSITLRSDILEDRDIQILEIAQTDQPKTTIINVYNDAPRGEQCILFKLRDISNSLPTHPTLITGDFNLHHPSWAREDRALDQDQLATSIADWLAAQNFSLLNKRGEITHLARHAGERPSVIDLSFANAEAVAQDTFKNWAVDPSFAYDSDHNAITLTIDYGLKEIQDFFPIKYNTKAIDPEEWSKTLDEELAKMENILNPLLNNEDPSNDQLDAYAETLSEIIQNTLGRTAPTRKPSPHAKPWWDKDLTEANKSVAMARTLNQNHQRLTGEFDHHLQTNVIRNRNYFKRLCKHKKKTWVNKTLENASANDIWTFPKWSRGIRNYPSTPPISRGPNRPRAVSHDDKCKALREELYQPPPALDQEFLPDLSTHRDTDLPFAGVTTEEVRDAIFKNNSNSAPGHSQVTYQVLRWVWANATGQKHILALMQKCLKNGYHPKSWRKAIAIALRKPNKPDYSNPRAYRLITLLECLGKVLERIVARRLTFLAGKLNLVPPTQFGGRSNSSTDDAILTFITDVQTAWSTGKVTSALTFDIKGYFDFVNHGRLLSELRRKNLPLEYVKWTASFLSNREAAICIDGRCGNMEPVDNGIPQGSPVSPILAAFYSAELLEKFSTPPQPPLRDFTPSHPCPVSIIMYVDDGKIYVSSTSLQTNVILLANAYKEVETWLRSAGLAPDLAKREIMHYSRRRRYDCSPPIILHDYDGTTRTLVPDRLVRWLGVHFDRKLLFNHHVKIAAARGENALQMLANTVRGLSHAFLRRLYLACIIPKILYACPTWWNDTKCQAKLLEKVQRKALCLICAAFRTTPTHALEIEASIPPLQLQAQLSKRRFAIRLNKLPISNAIIQCLPNAWRDNQLPTFPPPIPTTTPRRKAKSTLSKIAAFTNHDHERINPFSSPPWLRSLSLFPNRLMTKPCDKSMDSVTARDNHLNLLNDLKSNPRALYIYTDGSKLNNSGFYRVGAAAVAYHRSNEIANSKIGLGGHAEVFDAEMAAIAKAASLASNLIEELPNTNQIHIFSDSAASIRAIVDPKPSSAQFFTLSFHNQIRPLLETYPDLSITIAWCPSHCGITGNERADALAKEATALGCQIPFSTTRSNAKRRAKNAITKLWQKEWKNAPKVGRFAISNRFPPSLNPTKHFKHLKDKREVFGRVIQCRSGHAYTGEFRQSFLPLSPDPTACQCDNETLESRSHILLECPRYDQYRKILKKESRYLALPVLLGSNKGIIALAKFLHKSGAFSRTGTPYTTPPTPSLTNEPIPIINPPTDPTFTLDDGG